VLTLPDEPLSEIRERLLDGMVSYMTQDGEDNPSPEWDCGYTMRDVDRCAAIVDEYLRDVHAGAALDQTEITKAVKRVVIALNELNSDCDGALIETDQREDLCHLILMAAKSGGLLLTEDITYQWREW